MTETQTDPFATTRHPEPTCADLLRFVANIGQADLVYEALDAYENRTELANRITRAYQLGYWRADGQSGAAVLTEEGALLVTKAARRAA